MENSSSQYFTKVMDIQCLNYEIDTALENDPEYNKCRTALGQPPDDLSDEEAEDLAVQLSRIRLKEMERRGYSDIRLHLTMWEDLMLDEFIQKISSNPHAPDIFKAVFLTDRIDVFRAIPEYRVILLEIAFRSLLW